MRFKYTFLNAFKIHLRFQISRDILNAFRIASLEKTHFNGIATFRFRKGYLVLFFSNCPQSHAITSTKNCNLTKF